MASSARGVTVCRVHPWPVGSVGGVEGSAAAAGDLRRSDGLKLHEASDDQGSQCPDDVLAVQQVRLEGAQQAVPRPAEGAEGEALIHVVVKMVMPPAAAQPGHTSERPRPNRSPHNSRSTASRPPPLDFHRDTPSRRRASRVG